MTGEADGRAGVALVTGASSGIGRALSERLAADGWAVGLAARRKERLRETARRIRVRGGRAAVLPCDVGVRDEVRRAVARCEGDLGAVELLVANAGVAGVTRPETLDAAEVERVLRINFLGAVHAAESVLPGMRARGSGHLVAVSSLAGYGGLPRTAAYSASKAALTTFFESLRIDLRSEGVDVTVVAPGYVRTPMTDGRGHAMPFLVDLDDAAERIQRAIRRRRRVAAFPWPLAAAVRCARFLPRGVYDWLAARVDR